MLERLTGQWNETEGGNCRNGFAGFPADFTVEFALVHREVLEKWNEAGAHADRERI